MTPPDEARKNFITLRFFAPFGRKDHWEMEASVNSGETLTALFSRLPEALYREIREKVLDPPYPPFAVSVNGMMVSREDLFEIRVKEGDVVTLVARLVGG
jgi:sulfur carrier protein ThiS